MIPIEYELFLTGNKTIILWFGYKMSQEAHVKYWLPAGEIGGGYWYMRALTSKVG
jgi:hypothetical protein